MGLRCETASKHHRKDEGAADDMAHWDQAANGADGRLSRNLWITGGRRRFMRFLGIANYRAQWRQWGAMDMIGPLGHCLGLATGATKASAAPSYALITHSAATSRG